MLLNTNHENYYHGVPIPNNLERGITHNGEERKVADFV
ncbi:protein of unknown function [Candidatus Nitrosocosmicus franklandus]|uniref:Uncharacterized protein n=1 Tax=Candidatus Nitrosocosmicus franklandianus TaxID=1798806 RepID=A0A484IDH1_9ARCH|nr:protein of unknown function [Candidatus Nitrosocosmicus franklandus]